MISQREIDQLRREMRGMSYCSVPTDLLSELLESYEQTHVEARGLKLVEKKSQTDKKHTDD